MQKSILIKYGGNAMTDASLREEVLNSIAELTKSYKVILVHGGGPEIGKTLEMAGIESRFMGGHRVTGDDAIHYVEMALSGKVNGLLVSGLNRSHANAVGISGKSGNLVTARKRSYSEKGISFDLGHVGDVETVDPRILNILLDNKYTPVVSPVSLGNDGKDYNINADMFAGHLAAALAVDHYVVLTDVDGLRSDPKDAESLISDLSVSEMISMRGGAIQGGMIPKTESIEIALNGGASNAIILNGQKADQLNAYFLNDTKRGTKIYKD